jgi:acyl carrier protein
LRYFRAGALTRGIIRSHEAWDGPVEYDRAPYPVEPRFQWKGASVMQDVLEGVQRSFQSAFGLEPSAITIDTVPGDVDGWDSMGHVTLASSLEQEFKLSFDVDDLMAMENVREIVRVIGTKLGNG